MSELSNAKKQLRETTYRLLEALFEERLADMEVLAQDLVMLSTHIRKIKKRDAR